MEISEDIGLDHYKLLRKEHGFPHPEVRPVAYLGVAFLAGIMLFMANITAEWYAAIVGFGALGIFILVKILSHFLNKKTFVAWNEELPAANIGQGHGALKKLPFIFRE